MDRASSARRRALGQLPRRAVGETNRDDACHRAPFPAQPADRSWSGHRSWSTKGTGPPRRRPTRRSRGRCRAERAPSATGVARPVASSSSARERARACRGRRRARRAPRPGPPAPSPSGAPCATAPGGPPRRACPRPCASPSPRGSGARAGRGAPRPGPTPCTGRPRRRGCRATSTSWSRPGPTSPTWNQCRTNGLPVTDSDCAVSHSWWGNTRSRPPPWMSIVSPELAQREGRALDVPAGPTRSPTRLPGRLVGQRRLPEHEVERVALVGVVGMAAVLGRQREHLGPVEAAEPAELGEARRRRSRPSRPTGRRDPPRAPRR